MDGIFISYRRDDASGYAGRLYDRLVAQFGAHRVFMDVEGIELGADFVTAIEKAVGSCRVLIVVIGDEWLDIRDGQGRRRLDDPHDFIRLEVAAALSRDIRVVPVLVDGAQMPRAEELPEALQGLARRQAVAVHHNQWEGSTAKLIQALQRLLGERAGGGADGQGKGARWALAVGAVSALAVGGWWAWDGSGSAPAPPPGTLVAGAPPAAPTPAARPVPAPAEATAPRAATATPPEPAVVAAAPTPPTPKPPAAAVARPPSPATPRPSPAPAPAPAPAMAAPPARPPAAAPAAPSPAPRAEAPAATADARLPRPGQSWTYRVRGKWPTSPNREVVITTSAVRDGVVDDRLSDPAAAEPVQRRSRAGQGGFVVWPGLGMEFSPYLASTELLGWRGRGFSTPDIDPQWTQWHSQAQAIGHEAVTVPAGRFDAVKVEVWSSRTANGGVASINIEPVRVHYLVWYAPELQRYVRMQRRVISAAGQEIERDLFELVARRGG